MAPIHQSRGLVIDFFYFVLFLIEFFNLSTQLYLAENGNEKLLSSLYNYSDITNLEWRTHSVTLIGDSPSTLSV